jgi:hypothetical protein
MNQFTPEQKDNALREIYLRRWIMEDTFAANSDLIRILANDGYVKIDSIDFPSRDVLHAEATPLAESFLKEGGYTRRAEHQSRHQKEDKRQTEEAKMRYLLIVYSTLSGFLGSAILADNAPVLARCIAGIALLFFLVCLLVMASRVDKKNKTSDNSH